MTTSMTLNDLEPLPPPKKIGGFSEFFRDFRLLFSHLYSPGGRTILITISATIDYSSVKTVAARHRLAAYHNKHC